MPTPTVVAPARLPSSLRVREAISVIAALLVAGFFIFYRLGDASLWTDELVTLITARRALGDSLTQVEDQSAPLYQLLLRAMGSRGTVSEWAARLPAAIAGLLTMPAAWLLARVVHGPAVAAPTILILAVNPWLIYHAREARPYTLFVLFSVLSMLFFHWLLERRWWGYGILFVLCSMAASLSHFFALLLLAAQGTYWIADRQWGKSRRRRPDRALVSLLAAGLFSLPAVVLLFHVLRAGLSSTGSWVQATNLSGFVLMMGEVVGIDGIGAVFLVPLVACFWPHETPFDAKPLNWIDPAGRPRAWRLRRRSLYWCLWIIWGLWVVGLVSFFRPVLVVRYVLPVAVPLTILGVHSLRRVGSGAVWVVVVIFWLHCVPRDWEYRFARPGMREAIALIKGSTPESSLPPLFVADWSFCEDFVNPEMVGARLYGFEGPIGLLPRTGAGLAQKLDPGMTVWIISFQPHDQLLEPLIALGRPFRVHHHYLFRLYEVAPVGK